MSDVVFPQWKKVAVDEVFYVAGRIGWRGLKRSNFTEEGPYLITGMHIADSGYINWDECFHIPQAKYEESPEIKLAQGDLVITKDGTIGKVAYIDELPGPASLNSHLFLVRPKEGVMLRARFAYHVFRSRAFHVFIEQQKSGSTLAGLGERKFRKFLFPLPSLRVQDAVADMLDTLDTQIHRTGELIGKLEQIKQGLLTDLLTRGIAENGQLRPPPDQAPHLYKDSPLGRIPREWELSEVAGEFLVDSGFTLGAHRRPGKNAYPYLRVANVYRERLDLRDIAFLEARPDELEGKKLANGDLLVVEGHANPDEIGRCAMVTSSAEGLTFQNHLFRLRARRLLPLYALIWMNSSAVRSYWRATCASSSGLNTINRTKLLAVPVAVPPGPEQSAMASIAENLGKRVSAEDAELRKARAGRQGLMDDLLTGRVRVTPLLEKAKQAAG